jgi:hypothetical protein
MAVAWCSRPGSAPLTGRATVSECTRKEVSMCWSKHEREQWERERREAELEAKRIRLVSTTEPAHEPEPASELEPLAV